MSTVRRPILVALAVMLAVTSLGLGSAPVANAAAVGQPIVLRGSRDAFVDVTFTQAVSLEPVVANGDGPTQQTTSLGTTEGSYLGYLVLSLPELTRVAGFVAPTEFAQQLGRPATFSITFPEERKTQLPAGRYRFVLMTDGPSEARIETTNLAAPVVLDASTPHPSAGGSGATIEVPTGSVQEVTSAVDIALESDGMAIILYQESENALAFATNDCFMRRDAQTSACLPLQAFGSRGEATYGQLMNTDFFDPGFYKNRLRVQPTGTAQATVRQFALFANGGPRPTPVLPDGSEAAPAEPTLNGVDRSRQLDDGCPPSRVPTGGFADTEGSTHLRAIDCVAWYGIAKGQAPGRFAPGAFTRRDQMATFLARLIERAGVVLPLDPPDAFSDDTGSVHEERINQLAAVGVVRGTGARYLPSEVVRRDQLAALLHRSYALAVTTPLRPRADFFVDDGQSTHQGHINALASNGIVTGRASGTYVPADGVTRGQMASFLARTVDLMFEIGRVTPPR